MVYNIFNYRRPAYVPSLSSRESQISFNSTPSSIDKQQSGIPSSLTFDKIVSGGTCPPLTCRDFMRYLIYVERCAENLQFYLWYNDYVKRFENLSDNEKALAPQYVPSGPHVEAFRCVANGSNGVRSQDSMHRMLNNAFSSNKKSGLVSPSPANTGHINPFRTPPSSPGEDDSFSAATPFGTESAAESTMKEIENCHQEVSAKAFESVDVKWQPFTIQPFREEISRIIAIYLTEGAPRELNISSRDRITVVKALSQTTHPSTLAVVNAQVEYTLRFQSHPNFIRWSICNGNAPRIWFARSLGVFTILIGFMIATLVTLSDVRRGWRALAAIAWVIGIATYFSAHKGMCVVLHGKHHQNMRPWELWIDDTELEKSDSRRSFETYTTNTSNSYEDEPWVEKYQRRFVLRRIFDREVWIEEPALRQIQDTIAIQSFGIAFVVSAILSAIFVAIPGGHLF